MKMYQRSSVPFKVMDDVCYIIDSFQTKSAYKLNETSTTLWLYLEGKHSFSEIIEHFKDQYEGTSDEELTQDLRVLVDDMLKQSLIHECE